MASLWPWLAIAGLGALHGLNPATGWLFAAASGVRAHSRAEVLRAMLPIGIGHALAVAAVATLVVRGALDRGALQWLAGGLLALVAVAHHARHRAPPGWVRMPAGRIGLALWSFMMATAHGAGLVLVPALMPLCIGDAPARAIGASASLGLALAAVVLHMAAMLAAAGAMALAACRGYDLIGARLVHLRRASAAVK